MSGICGLWDLRGAALPPDPLAPVMARLRRRGPDGAHTWQDGPVALGHSCLATTPEAQHETLPLTHAETGCTITADARLDNRPELLTALELERAGRVIGDGELILCAYLRWGEDCTHHLLGDFAFAIWDPRRHVIFCARDHMGMRQLIYTHLPGRLFAFATDARALVTLEAVPARLNEARVLDLLDGDLEAVDDEITFFEGVLRLSPAHIMTVDAQGLQLRRYWRLEPGTPLELPSDAAYAEAFTDVFTEAVRCRVRSPETPASMLSGGMDSGSVVAVASGLLAAQGRGPLPTFSGTGPDQGRVETRLVAAAMGMEGIAPTAIRHDALDALLPGLRAWIDDPGEPFDRHMSMIAAVYGVAGQAGHKVVLDGVAGDTAFATSYGLETAVRNRRYRDILTIARDEALETRRWQAFWMTLVRAGWRGLAPELVRRRRSTRRARREIDRHLAQSLAAPDLIERHDLAGRLARDRARWDKTGLGPHMQRVSVMTAGYVTVARERYDRVAGDHAIEPRDPFLDPRVLGFCLSLPETQLVRNGYRKAILRTAMGGRIPEAILRNRTRDHHGLDFTAAVFVAAPDLQHGVHDCAGTTRGWLRDGIEAGFPGQRGTCDLDSRTRLVFLDRFLRQNTASSRR